MTEALMVENISYILALRFKGKWFPYLFSVLRNISYKLGKIQTTFIILFCPKKRMEKNDGNLRLNCTKPLYIL